MAALASAIVVGGGVNTYAAEPAPTPAPTEGTNDALPKTDEQKIADARANALAELQKAGLGNENNEYVK